MRSLRSNDRKYLKKEREKISSDISLDTRIVFLYAFYIYITIDNSIKIQDQFLFYSISSLFSWSEITEYRNNKTSNDIFSTSNDRT